METAQGIASHCQNTSRVSGGGNNGQVSTTYIALFRLGQRQVQFPSGSPLSISDGDQVVVAGIPWRGALSADAVCNVTTGLVRHSGIASRIFTALLVLIIGAVVTLGAMRIFGTNGGWVFLAFMAGAVFLFWRALQTINALQYVKTNAPAS